MLGREHSGKVSKKFIGKFYFWGITLKCLATGLDAFLSSFSTSRRCSRNRSPSRLPVSPMYNFLQRVQVIQEMTYAEVQVKWSVTLMDRSGLDNFSTLQMKGHVLHRARAHLKVPGWLLIWNALELLNAHMHDAKHVLLLAMLRNCRDQSDPLRSLIILLVLRPMSFTV